MNQINYSDIGGRIRLQREGLGLKPVTCPHLLSGILNAVPANCRLRVCIRLRVSWMWARIISFWAVWCRKLRCRLRLLRLWKAPARQKESSSGVPQKCWRAILMNYKRPIWMYCTSGEAFCTVLSVQLWIPRIPDYPFSILKGVIVIITIQNIIKQQGRTSWIYEERIRTGEVIFFRQV